MRWRLFTPVIAVLLLMLSPAVAVQAQPDEGAKATAAGGVVEYCIVILEPDPVLQADATLRERLRWIEEETGKPVVIARAASEQCFTLSAAPAATGRSGGRAWAAWDYSASTLGSFNGRISSPVRR